MRNFFALISFFSPFAVRITTTVLQEKKHWFKRLQGNFWGLSRVFYRKKTSRVKGSFSRHMPVVKVGKFFGR